MRKETLTTAIATALNRKLRPFETLAGDNGLGLPSLAILELARETDLSPERILENLPGSIELSDQRFSVRRQPGGDPPTIPVKKLIKQAVKQRPSGANTFVKAAFEELVKAEKVKRRKLFFQPFSADTENFLRNRRRSAIRQRLAQRATQRQERSDMSNKLWGVASTLTQFSEQVLRAKWKNLDRLNSENVHSLGGIAVAVEFCPLYQGDTALAESVLRENPLGERDIIDSRVGKKWTAIQLALLAVKDALDTEGIGFKVRATFADVGVFIAEESLANPNLVKRHGDLYRECFGKFCQKEGIGLEFRTLKDLQPVNPSVSHMVPEFIIPSRGEVLPPTKDIEKILGVAGFSPEEIKSGGEDTLKVLFEICGRNTVVFSGLVNTYLNFRTTPGCQIHLGIEIIDPLLALHTAIRGSHIATITELNLQVE